MERVTNPAIACAFVLAVFFAQNSALAGQRTTDADLVVIRKSERTLSLVKGTNTVRTFPIKLGGNPSGHKQKEGDARTPEGRYFIEYKNPDSRFFLSLKISYPNKHDRARARSLGVSPGGNIMIHGMPDEPRVFRDRYYQEDWTDGCIAVTNAAMREIWLAVRELTPVVIYP